MCFYRNAQEDFIGQLVFLVPNGNGGKEECASIGRFHRSISAL